MLRPLHYRLFFTRPLRPLSRQRFATMPIKTTLPRIIPPEDMNIGLTEVEEQLCVLCDECAQHIKHTEGLSTTCRIAGGWVRDKLLGSQSNDIDIALSDIMGLPFAKHLAAFADKKGLAHGGITTVAQNPDQSKHLETSMIKILGLELDLVNLRSEEYASDSRIPTEVAFGTPLQDALRRDITINALFYNMHTRAVEDFTKVGLDDLKNGIIRTPLPPRETFMDDPLRVLRCIRFASRFGFDVVPEIAEASKDPEIQRAIVSKISRERGGEELSKMMKGRDPVRAIQLINDFRLYDSIFSVIPDETVASFSSPPADRIVSLKSAYILHTILTPPASPDIPSLHPTLLSIVKKDTACRARLFLAATLSPYIGITYRDKKKKSQAAVELVIRESLKLGTQNHFLNGIPALFAAAPLLRNPDLGAERFKGPSDRVEIGLLLREKVIHNPNTGSHWTTSLLFSAVQELASHYDYEADKLNVDEATKIINVYNTFVGRVEELCLTDVGDERPLLDGREVMSILGAKPGAWTGQVLSQVMQWQLQHPQGSKDDCSAWLKGEQLAGKVIAPVDSGEKTSEPASKRPRTKR